MKRIKSYICAALVIATVFAVTVVSSAGTNATFSNVPVNSSYYTYLAGSKKTTTSTQATVYVSAVVGDSYANLRGGTSASTAYTYGVSQGHTYTITLRSPYTTKGDTIGLYGIGLNYTHALSGTWNAN